MNIGHIIIFLAFASCLSFMSFYFMADRTGRKIYLKLGRISYTYFSGFVLAASGLLLYLILSGDYSYKYIYDYSSSDLDFFIKVSSFWAGQQGSYLLWLSFLAILGYFLIFRGREYTPLAMTFYGLVNLYFCIILMALSPFDKLMVPQMEGAGLNPLLIDYWMVIHPPIMFIGYATVALPAVIAMAALARNRYKNWGKIAFAPIALATLALATGNILGGFWAYKTLGWGGYWAWDPVENSSFIPWIVSLALVHSMIIERKSGSLPKTNLFLAMLTFLLVIYGTYLTRSGVLQDFSVHSFVDLGINVWLIGFMLIFIFMTMTLFFLRVRSISGPPVNLQPNSRFFALLSSVWLLLVIAFMVLAGTSWPLITGLFRDAASVDTAVYTRMTLPLTIIIGIVLGFTPLMSWKSEKGSSLLKRAIPSAIGAVVATVVGYIAGVQTVSYLLFVFSASFAFFSNLVSLVKAVPRGVMKLGAHLSHFGFALMLIGILGSSGYSETKKVVINRGENKSAFGLQITYNGMAEDLDSPTNEVLLGVADDEEIFESRPRLFFSEKLQGLMKKPSIKRYFLYDIYFAPEQIQEMDNADVMELARGDMGKAGPFAVTFLNFSQNDHASSGAMEFGAVLELMDFTGFVDTVTPAIIFESGQDMTFKPVEVEHEGKTLTVKLEKIFADQGAVRVSIGGIDPDLPPDRLLLEVSRKPVINFLWVGTFLLMSGGLISMVKRWKASRLERRAN